MDPKYKAFALNEKMIGTKQMAKFNFERVSEVMEPVFNR
jgi:hypothetical protein